MVGPFKYPETLIFYIEKREEFEIMLMRAYPFGELPVWDIDIVKFEKFDELEYNLPTRRPQLEVVD